MTRLHGQAVKTSPFHGGNTGSIPVGVILASWLSWLERRPVTAEVVGSSPIGVVWFIRDLSSAGRASALQAEGHRFEPYRSHAGLLRRRGGTGRRPGLKIPWVAIPVPVRFRSPALRDKLQIEYMCV